MGKLGLIFAILNSETWVVKANKEKGLNSNQGQLGILRSEVHTAEKILKDVSQALDNTIADEVGSLDNFILLTSLLGLLFALSVIGVLIWLAGSILRPIKQLSSIMKQSAQDNDLSLRAPIVTQDEMGETSLAFNFMMDQFQEIIMKVNASVTHITSFADEMSANTLQTRTGAQEQQTQTDQLATAMNQMTATVQEVANSAVEAANAAAEADSESNMGRQVVDTAVSTINTLSEEIQQAASSIQRLEKDSDQIGSVLDVIKAIAEQTNLLALNAAIEAARAGEQGRGFAVVADEVRTLAGRTQESTQEIQHMVETLQNGVKEVVMLMNKSQEQTVVGVEQTSKAGDALTEIVSAVKLISDMNTQIASAVEEQGMVAQEINRNVINIHDVAGQTVQGSDRTTEASKNLSYMATDLKALVMQFKLSVVVK